MLLMPAFERGLEVKFLSRVTELENGDAGFEPRTLLLDSFNFYVAIPLHKVF